MTPAQINKAVAAGIISEEQGLKMLELFVSDASADVAPSEGGTKSFLKHFDDSDKISQTAAEIVGQENLRFLRDFNDIFIAIGVGILGFGLYVAAGMTGSAYGLILPAIVMWVLAEFFGGKKRQHLPTLLTALFFVLATSILLWKIFAGSRDFSELFMVGNLEDGAFQVGKTGAIVASGGLLAALAFYVRFRFPFCVYLIGATAVGLFYSLMLMVSVDLVQTYFGPIIFLSGLVSFAIAVWYDQKDLTRLQRFSDNAFWLHLIAAPLILTGIMLWKFGFRLANLTTGDAVVLLVLVAILGILGLAVNRRALLVSALIWTATGLFYIFQNMGDTTMALMMTLLCLGGGVIFLGVAWGKTRHFLLKFLPRHGVWSRIFPPEGAVLRGRVADY